ncbi:tubulin-specific chaperone Rbl2 [Usnea florida]
MPPPTPLSIATNALTRLLKEESSYRTELASQRRRVEQLQSGAAAAAGDEEEEEEEGEEGNREFRLGQEKRALEETNAVFGPLRERIRDAVGKVEGLLVSQGTAEGPEVEAANGALVRAREGS